jgi:CDGSH iron-sulfur domain-containing protein 1
MVRMVTMKDTRPLVIRPEDLKDGPVWICRCGLSAKWPYCDDSHKRAREEGEDDVCHYRRSAPDAPLERAAGMPKRMQDADPRPAGL